MTEDSFESGLNLFYAISCLLYYNFRQGGADSAAEGVILGERGISSRAYVCACSPHVNWPHVRVMQNIHGDTLIQNYAETHTHTQCHVTHTRRNLCTQDDKKI